MRVKVWQRLRPHHRQPEVSAVSSVVEGVAAVWAKFPDDFDPRERGTHPSSVVNRQSDKDISV
jgi:hypothetical protein